MNDQKLSDEEEYSRSYQKWHQAIPQLILFSLFSLRLSVFVPSWQKKSAVGEF